MCDFLHLAPVPALIYSIYQHFIADRNELLVPFLAGLWGLFVLNKLVKFNDPALNRSQEIPLEVIERGIFDCFPL